MMEKNDREIARQLLQEAGIEIDLSDHRSAVEIAQAFGLMGINTANEQTPQTEVTQVVLIPRKKNSPYLAH